MPKAQHTMNGSSSHRLLEQQRLAELMPPPTAVYERGGLPGILRPARENSWGREAVWQVEPTRTPGKFWSLGLY